MEEGYKLISFYIMERKRSDRVVLIATFLRRFLGGSLLFFLRRRVADFFRLEMYLMAFLASVMVVDLQSKPFKKKKGDK